MKKRTILALVCIVSYTGFTGQHASTCERGVCHPVLTGLPGFTVSGNPSANLLITANLPKPAGNVILSSGEALNNKDLDIRAGSKRAVKAFARDLCDED